MIDQGEDVEITCIFRSGGELSDPTPPVGLRIMKPDGSIDTIENVERDSEGVYKHRYTTTGPGPYRYTFFSADNAIQQGSFSASPDFTLQ